MNSLVKVSSEKFAPKNPSEIDPKLFKFGKLMQFNSNKSVDMYYTDIMYDDVKGVEIVLNDIPMTVRESNFIARHEKAVTWMFNFKLDENNSEAMKFKEVMIENENSFEKLLLKHLDDSLKKIDSDIDQFKRKSGIRKKNNNKPKPKVFEDVQKYISKFSYISKMENGKPINSNKREDYICYFSMPIEFKTDEINKFVTIQVRNENRKKDNDPNSFKYRSLPCKIDKFKKAFLNNPAIIDKLILKLTKGFVNGAQCAAGYYCNIKFMAVTILKKQTLTEKYIPKEEFVEEEYEIDSDDGDVGETNKKLLKKAVKEEDDDDDEINEEEEIEKFKKRKKKFVKEYDTDEEI